MRVAEKLDWKGLIAGLVRHCVVFCLWCMITTTGPAVHRHRVTGPVTQHTSTPQSEDIIFLRNIGKLDQFRTVSTPKSTTDINRSVSSGVRNLFLFAGHEDA
jgi:hypothetical protein